MRARRNSTIDVLTPVVLPFDIVPESIDSERQKTAEALVDLLEGEIVNLNTRQAYKIAWRDFFAFCSESNLTLDLVRPRHFELWRKRHPGSVATKRQHMAAIRRLFDCLLEKGVVELNPAARARVPPLKRDKAHTPIFETDEMRDFLDGIKRISLIDIRDKALFSTMFYTWARVSAVVALTVDDYFLRKGDRWLRLQEKRGKIHEVPVHEEARKAIDDWLKAAEIGGRPLCPLFPAFCRSRELFEPRPMTRINVWKLVKSRARAIGLEKLIGCHSFRATGLTEYMNAGGQLDIAQGIAGHAQLSTTKLYDRSQDRVTIAEIQRVSLQTHARETAT